MHNTTRMSNTKDDEYHKHFRASCAETNANSLEAPVFIQKHSVMRKLVKSMLKSVLGNSASV
jgi:hypothetical protein